MDRQQIVRVAVVDTERRPVVGATIWIGLKRQGDDRDFRELMSRLAEHHSRDADYVRALNLLPTYFYTDYSNLKGVLEIDLGEGELPEHLVVAVLKRGFDSEIRELPISSKKDISVVLRESGRSIPELEEFDRLRGEAFGAERAGLSLEERSVLLRQHYARASSLAKSLEDRDHLAAATIYLGMADMPSVDSGPGSVLVANGFDRRNPRRLHDFATGLSLGSESPVLEIEGLINFEATRRATGGDLDAREKLDFLERGRKIVQNHGPQMWPVHTIWLADLLGDLGRYDESCSMLAAAYASEPAYYSTQGWNVAYIMLKGKWPAGQACVSLPWKSVH